MKIDYIVVGLGIAGLALTHELEKHNKSYVVFENSSQTSSKVAGGMYNPIILKRFTPVWDAINQLEIALPLYKEMESLLGGKYDYELKIKRLLTSIEEQNDWFKACDNPSLTNYMIPSIDKKTIKGISSPYGYGVIEGTGRIDTVNLLKDYSEYISSKILFEDFDYNQLDYSGHNIVYRDITARKIVFCEGFGIKKNPLFNYLPLQEAKGELITIYSEQLDIDFVLKSSIFIVPLGDNLFKVGATFNWKDKTNLPTSEGKEELVSKLNKVIDVPYEIVHHVAGIRPTVKDRRPLVGTLEVNNNIAVLNGLGTRGVMIAPTVAIDLYNHLEEEMPIKKEIDITRFKI